VVFAYTIKGWRAAHRRPPGQPLRPARRGAVRGAGRRARHGHLAAVRRFARGSVEARAVRGHGRAARAPVARRRGAAGGAGRDVPAPRRPGVDRAGVRPVFVDLSHDAPQVAERVVTVAPDVASSTNLGGWINRVGIWSPGDAIDWFADDPDTLVRWRESDHGQHIELGIAEVNLVGLLGELGATWSRDGQPLLPVGTIYDPFVTRATSRGRSASTPAASRSSSARRRA
jgi:pyruvate dehydrogenase E1 component